ncbi:MAG TPA: hypothetical protein D7H85_04190 [Candidatus Poseidoniales archaeon]|nr:MAG TPA: hypothetical protein D7H85_04190 [Candidatus Poseidoniales archaeon]
MVESLGGSMSDEAGDGLKARLSIRVGNSRIDLEGTEQVVTAELLKLRADEQWSTALEKVRETREKAFEAARIAAMQTGLPERGSAFSSLVTTCQLTKKPDMILAAIHYLREVEGQRDSPPRELKQLFIDAGHDADDVEKWNISLYLNRLREQGRLTFPEDMPEKNRFMSLTDEGRAHLDSRAAQ